MIVSKKNEQLLLSRIFGKIVYRWTETFIELWSIQLDVEISIRNIAYSLSQPLDGRGSASRNHVT
jgi:hypothetical protein